MKKLFVLGLLVISSLNADTCRTSSGAYVNCEKICITGSELYACNNYFSSQQIGTSYRDSRGLCCYNLPTTTTSSKATIRR